MPNRSERKIFVLDTSAILFDHNAIHNFKEHDVAIPITVLEEIDRFKKGNDVINFEAREFIRNIDKLSGQHSLQDWIPLNGPTKGMIRVLMMEHATVDANKVFGEKKADHNILNAALYLAETSPGRKVILVSKDINLRLKAKSLNLKAEDYKTGKIKDLEGLYSGSSILENVSSKHIDSIYNSGSIHASQIIKKGKPVPNHYYVLKSKDGSHSALTWYNPETDGLERISKETAYGIRPRNAEQAFAMHAVMNPAIKLVTIQGVAGTGKTLIALASALQTRQSFRQIYLARPIVPLSNKDIGYLPGDIKSKINPYMEPLWDNLKFIQGQY
ncbi:MAG: PhoH family protein, partial [Bacteroidota bacterium]